ncbi:hypothetical protein Xoosp13_350 [Xanthomonas phage Xoo-sp13]|nr:hypothetical protein Xoosp13_350 [Xanthomonas phage Xoo-sp13]
MKSGIYSIYNTVNDKQYIGSSKDISKRFRQHKMQLKSGKHINVYLQRAYNKYGPENFKYIVIEYTTELFDREQYYINNNKESLYNLGTVGGGDNLTNHPDREIIIAKITKTMQTRMDNRTSLEIDIQRNKMLGEANPNYGNKWSPELRIKVSNIVKDRIANEPKYKEICKKNMIDFWNNITPERYSEFCARRKEVMLSDNPFKGKKHSAVTKKYLSEKISNNHSKMTAEERFNKNPQIVKVRICGVVYFGLSEAGRQLGISPALMRYRLRSTSPKWAEYEYCT